MTLTMKLAAPNLGVNMSAAVMYATPATPPSHHQAGPWAAAPKAGPGTRISIIKGTTTNTLTANEDKVAHNGCPRARPNAALLAA